MFPLMMKPDKKLSSIIVEKEMKISPEGEKTDFSAAKKEAMKDVAAAIEQKDLGLLEKAMSSFVTICLDEYEEAEDMEEEGEAEEVGPEAKKSSWS